MAIVRLRRPLERAIAAGHPWVYRDALHPPLPKAGEVVTIVGESGRFVARGIADDGPIGVRVWTTANEPIDEGLVRRRLSRALSVRDRVIPAGTDAYRLLHGEGDRMPGVVCDRYAAYAVLVFDGAGAAAWKDTVVECLREALAPRGVETLLVQTGRRKAKRIEVAWGAPPPGPVTVQELGMTLVVDLLRGQKTGLFLDHRDSRRRVRDLARGRRVLNLYGYTGAFSVAAGLGGAAFVRTVDSAKEAIALASKTWSANDLDIAKHDPQVADVPRALKAAAREGARFELVVADPPSFAPNERSVPRALVAYRALHTAVLRLMADDGLYLAASCSSHVRRPAFEETVLKSARDEGRGLEIVDRWGAGPDHPVLPSFPEGEYLKAVLVRVLSSP